MSQGMLRRLLLIGLLFCASLAAGAAPVARWDGRWIENADVLTRLAIEGNPATARAELQRYRSGS